MRSLIVSCVIVFLGCGRRGEQPAACVPGAVVTCPCAGTSSGTQTCQGNGTFGACVCHASSPAAPIARLDDPDKPPPVTAPPETPPAARLIVPAVRTPVAARPAVPPRDSASATPAPWIPTMEHCAGSTSCEECAHRSGCGWCSANRVCLPTMDCSGPINRSCSDGWYCHPGSCPSPRETAPAAPVDPCARNTDCRSCAIGEACAWCGGRAACRERGNANAGACLTSWIIDENACYQ
jgi:hypothetical protein